MTSGKWRVGLALVAGWMSATAIWAEDAREIGDTYINSASPTTNFGGAGNLQINDAHISSLIQFDLTLLPGGTSASNIEKVVLYLYVDKITTAGAIDIAQVTSAWSENQVTYNTRPTVGAIQGTMQAPASALNQWIALDLTPLGKFWVTSPASNFGISITSSLSAPTTAIMLDAKENTATSHAIFTPVILLAANKNHSRSIPPIPAILRCRLRCHSTANRH